MIEACFKAGVLIGLISLLSMHYTEHGVNTDLMSVKYEISQVAESLAELIDKHEQLQFEIEKVSEQHPAISTSGGRSKTELGNNIIKVSKHGFEFKDYDLKVKDYALESAGGRIVDTGDTINYVQFDSPIHWILFQLSSTLCKGCDGARVMLQPSSMPGECWAFRGSRGAAVIQLLGSIYVTGVSLQHISPDIAPTGDISSAPRLFTIEGLKSKNAKKVHVFGTFEYNKEGKQIQYFEASPSTDYYNLVRLRIMSNWGHPVFTCVYRVRVHGHLAPGQGYITEEKRNEST